MADGKSAYDYYLEGRQRFKALTRADNQAAKAAFESAIELDPGFARAYGWLGYAHLQDVQDGWTDDPAESLATARDLARKGVEVSGTDYYTHWNLASVLAGLEETEAAEGEYKAALALNAGDADVLADMADLLSYRGGASAAKAVGQLQAAMDMKIPQWYHWSLGFAYFQQRDYENALRALQRMSNPPNTAFLLLAACEAKLGKPRPPGEILERLLKTDPSWTPAYLNRFPFADPEDEKHYLDSMRAIGIDVPRQ
jgi:adenylate cyclase